MQLSYTNKIYPTLSSAIKLSGRISSSTTREVKSANPCRDDGHPKTPTS